jgi:hypothetical protein
MGKIDGQAGEDAIHLDCEAAQAGHSAEDVYVDEDADVERKLGDASARFQHRMHAWEEAPEVHMADGVS